MILSHFEVTALYRYLHSSKDAICFDLKISTRPRHSAWSLAQSSYNTFCEFFFGAHCWIKGSVASASAAAVAAMALSLRVVS